MIIGIDGSRAFLNHRTGIEEYSYQVIKHLTKELKNCQVVLYIRNNQEVDFDLPENWKIKKLWLPYFSSQIRFSLEFLFNPIDTLFIPAHVVPPIHPKNTIVVVHGLEYEFVPGAYSRWAKFYMRAVIKNSCRWAKKIIAVSNNTKNDLIRLYNVSKDKIIVIHEGYNCNFQFPISNFQSIFNDKISKPYLLFVGRLEERKNIVGIVKAFEILKEHYKIPHKLILAGNFGYGKPEIRRELADTSCASDIILPGYVSEEEKWELLKNADAFLFPTFYEGFGIPVLEAQASGVPVVAGNNSSIPEITFPKVQPSEFRRFNLRKNLRKEGSAILVNPSNAEEIADATYKLISNPDFKSDIIQKGCENVKRFSWDKCAAEIASLLIR